MPAAVAPETTAQTSVASRTRIRADADGPGGRSCDRHGVEAQTEHRPLCTIELVAEGHAGRCPGETCPFWERGCVLTRVEAELDGRPEVAALLLDLRRRLERGRAVELEEAHVRFAHFLNEDERID